MDCQRTFFTKYDSPVVTRADLMAEGDQSGCADLMRATIPVT